MIDTIFQLCLAFWAHRMVSMIFGMIIVSNIYKLSNTYESVDIPGPANCSKADQKLSDKKTNYYLGV